LSFFHTVGIPGTNNVLSAIPRWAPLNRIPFSTEKKIILLHTPELHGTMNYILSSLVPYQLSAQTQCNGKDVMPPRPEFIAER